jgi:hypothetical protein
MKRNDGKNSAPVDAVMGSAPSEPGYRDREPRRGRGAVGEARLGRIGGHHDDWAATRDAKFELYLAIEDIDHSRTKTKSPQANGICERSTRPCPTNLPLVPSAKKCTVRSMSRKLIWTRGPRVQ